jgi:hypothetical protein
MNYSVSIKVGTTTWLTELLHVSNVKIKLKGIIELDF